MPNLILYNGKLHTQDSNYPHATAIAFRDGRILAVGSDAELRNVANASTQQIDLQGRRVLPGLIDAHFHYYDWALARKQLMLAQATSLADLRSGLAAAAAKIPAGNWILGLGWNETRWPEPKIPTCSDLDDLTPNHPAILWRNDLHLAVANSLALHAAKITTDTPNPPQGVIDRDVSGQPTGVLRELAIDLVRAVIPQPTDAEVMDAFRDGFAPLHRLGLVGVHDFRIMGGECGPPAFRAYQQLQAEDELALRIWMLLPGQRLDEAIAMGLRTGHGNDLLRVGHVKYFSDGAQGARTAWMLEPYDDVDNLGLPLTPIDEIADAAYRAHRAGLAVAVHAIGDRANQEIINIFEEVLSKHTGSAAPQAPHRIEHVQNIHPDDVSRLGQMGVTASVQPIHAPDDYPMIEQSVGPRGSRAYPLRDLLIAGVPLALGSDCPVADPNPFWGIHAAVTRQMRDGTAAGGWYPDQCLSVSEAVWGYTMGCALAAGQERATGSLTPGKFADLIVLDRDIFAVDPISIADTQVEMTVLGGRIVHRS